MAKDGSLDLRAEIDAAYLADERAALQPLIESAGLSRQDRSDIAAEATDLVRRIRTGSDPGLMEVFLAEYGLSTEEGVALMCLAEALLRVPDDETIDALIEDKIAPSDWGKHLGHSSSSLVNASTWALMLTGRVLDDDRPAPFRTLRGAIKRLGEPVIRAAVGRAMKVMGRQFVLGESIESAMVRARGMEAKGFTYSYDMLGEAARTADDASAFMADYEGAIKAISKAATGTEVAENPGISVKLSALHPRYEVAQHDRVMEELVPRVKALASQARSAGIGLNIDAEEADRLSISLDVIEAVLADPALEDWDGFGVVVQAYGQRAAPVIAWLHALAERLDRRIMVRLVKGAYWDSEVKRAQIEGLEGFPVFTDKAATDLSYIGNAARLLDLTDRIYPQFATHNAHTVAAILHLAERKGVGTDRFEFQRLHGMGEALHKIVLARRGTRCRIYAPVGAHEDLLAYLVRRLLENGANSSFVNRLVDDDVPPEQVAGDPFEALGGPRRFPAGPALFGERRRNSRGWDLTHAPVLRDIDDGRAPHMKTEWQARPIVAFDAPQTARVMLKDPASGRPVGHVDALSAPDAPRAFDAAGRWTAPVEERARILRRAADLYEARAPEFFARLAREAGKTLPDCVGEVREAVDFLRFYAVEAEAAGSRDSRGIWLAISPWNFPLAIFSGQIAAALAAGNGVLAKPAPQTPLVAALAVELLHEAGVPRPVLQLLPGGAELGAALTALPGLAGVVFTGSTATAGKIARSVAANAAPGTPLIAETGGQNAMILDSTALPEHAVRDIVMSTFRSAGQRCSALRCLYVQEDVAGKVLPMLKGAMDELRLGDPWHLSTDVGPVIDAEAKSAIDAHISEFALRGRLLHQLDAPKTGHFVPPTLIEVDDIAEMRREVFGPVLHVARFSPDQLDAVIDDINATGYGLTFGLHTRIDDRVQHIVDRVEAGNIYVNRNQIGAIVGSQPFGGEGLSGTGPKAGGPCYLDRFFAPAGGTRGGTWDAADKPKRLQRACALAAANRGAEAEPLELPGPTGESNRYTSLPRGPILCLGPGGEAAAAQAVCVRDLGGQPVEAEGRTDPATLTTLWPLAAVIWWGDATDGRAIARALAEREGPIVPLVTDRPDAAHVRLERHVCIDTTAAGGNAALLAEVAGH